MAVATFMKDCIKSALAHRACTTEKEDPRKRGKMSAYCQIVNYLLVTYDTNDIIAGAEAEITKLKQSDYMSAVTYSEDSWKMALRCGRVFEYARFKEVFVK